MKFVRLDVINAGETTCASAPGVFCKYLGVVRFGTKPVCMWENNIPLQENSSGWVARSKKCLTEFSNDK